MKTTFPKQGSPRPESTGAEVLEIAQISPAVEDVLAATPFIDIHTHLFAPSFGKLGLWGIDELVTYHYLEAEFFRSSHTQPEQYFALPKTHQADAIWRALFVENTPISESTQGSPRPESTGAEVLEIAQISPAVEDVLAATPFIDIHTHLFAPSFGKLGLWGIDELVTYHKPSLPNEGANR